MKDILHSLNNDDAQLLHRRAGLNPGRLNQSSGASWRCWHRVLRLSGQQEDVSNGVRVDFSLVIKLYRPLRKGSGVAGGEHVPQDGASPAMQTVQDRLQHVSVKGPGILEH
jgi:hypothetical protein